MIGQYILKGKVPVPCDDLLTWGRWMQTANRHVAQDDVGECWVSTVFLGLDHNHWGKGPPILFETMAFGPPESKEIFGRVRDIRPEVCSMDRYATWDEALAGHRRILAEVERYVLDTAISADEALMAIAGAANKNGPSEDKE